MPQIGPDLHERDPLADPSLNLSTKKRPRLGCERAPSPSTCADIFSSCPGDCILLDRSAPRFFSVSSVVFSVLSIKHCIALPQSSLLSVYPTAVRVPGTSIFLLYRVSHASMYTRYMYTMLRLAFVKLAPMVCHSINQCGREQVRVGSFAVGAN